MLHRPADSLPAQQLCSFHTDRLHLPSHRHTHSLTHPHTLLTHSSLTHTYPHILLTHLNTSFEHSSHTPQTHTLFTPTYTLTHTHPHILTHTHSSYPHTHTPSHTSHLHTYTHTHTHTHNHRAYRNEDTGYTGTQGQCSHTRHMEHVGTAQSPS